MNNIAYFDRDGGKTGNENEDEDKGKGKPSFQLQFSRWLSLQGCFKVKNGLIYEFVGTHWQLQDFKLIKRRAFGWLAEHFPSRASEKSAESCAASASLHLVSVVS